MEIKVSDKAQFQTIITSVNLRLRYDFNETMKELITELYNVDSKRSKNKITSIRYTNGVLTYFGSSLICFDISYDDAGECIVLHLKPRKSPGNFAVV